MNIIITTKLSRNKEKNWYYLEWGKNPGQRRATKIFTYTRPKDSLQKNHNKEALSIVKTKQSRMTLEAQAIRSGYIPQHKLQVNFLDYYAEFVTQHTRRENRHLANSLTSFKKFTAKDFLPPTDITENLCLRFKTYLLDRFNGETPLNYFTRFKKVIKAATKEGYFLTNPSEDIKSKANKNIRIKNILEAQEYMQLLKTPCLNYEVQKAFVFSLYTGIRWIDVKSMSWENIKETTETFLVYQHKTGVPLERPLHPIARKILGERKNGLLFHLPTQDGANKILKSWCHAAGIHKNITWHCARHSFSVLLQDNGVDAATVAGMLGHTSTQYVHKTYQRYRHANAKKAIMKLPI